MDVHVHVCVYNCSSVKRLFNRHLTIVILLLADFVLFSFMSDSSLAPGGSSVSAVMA